MSSLSLALFRCSRLASVEGLRCLGGLGALQSLYLFLGGCPLLANEGWLQRLADRAGFKISWSEDSDDSE